MLARELVLEMSREVYAPEAPARLNACFVCPTWEEAERYMHENDQNLTWVPHRVEFVDPEAPQHTGYLEKLVIPNDVFLDPTRIRARDYWRGDGQGDREIVTASALRVIEPLQ